MPSNAIRIVVLDSYMSPPTQGLDVMYSEFRASSVNQVPILRCFGSTGMGKKICVHIHGVFPYLCIPYDGIGEVNSVMYHIASSIDSAINISLNQATATTQHVYRISLVSGLPMYGYHKTKHQFFKIYLYNPLLLNKVSDILRNVSLLGKFYQPHDAHINFTLQFMIDYNLHGMSNMLLSDIKYRVSAESQDYIVSSSVLSPAVQRISTCELEADVLAENILNREEISSGNLAINPGIAALWEDEKQRKRNKEEESQIGNFLEMKSVNINPTNSHIMFRNALLERLAVTAENKDNDEGNTSVYPAETPKNSDIENVSCIDTYKYSGSELSLDDTIVPSQSMSDSDLDRSLLPNSCGNETLNLLSILNNLEENAEANLEDDSILSQRIIEEEEDDKFDLDLSLPFEAVTTPKKPVFENKQLRDSNEMCGNIFDDCVIPQVDGQSDCDINYTYLNKLTEYRSRSGNSGQILNVGKHIGMPIKRQCEPILHNTVLCKEIVGHPKKLILMCDGVNDSSSSDEETNMFQTRYKTRFDRKERTGLRKIQETASDENNTKSNTKITKDSGSSFKVESIKRKLEFNINSQLNTTIIEEHAVCTYSPSYPKHKRLVSCISDVSGESLTNSLNNTNSNMFSDSENEENTNSVQNAVNISMAEKYDKGKNYKAIEGCSSVLTPQLLQTFSCNEHKEGYLKHENNWRFSRQTDSQFITQNQALAVNSHETEKKYPVKTNKHNISICLSASGTFKSVVLQPSSKPPSRKMVLESLDNYKIPKVRQQEPYFSKFEDVTGSVEIGYSVLKILSRTSNHLPDFNSHNDSINVFRKSALEKLSQLKWSKSNIKNLKLVYCPQKSVIVTPVHKPPSTNMVIKWLKEKSKVDFTPEHKKPERVKIIVPLSPGNEHEELDMSLTLSPVTPSVSQPTSQSTDELNTTFIASGHSSRITNDNKYEGTPKQKKRISQTVDHKLKKNILISQEGELENSCRITGVSRDNSFSFNRTIPNLQEARAVVEHQHLTLLIMEVHTRTRADLKPDPAYDPIRAIFYNVINDVPEDHEKKNKSVGVFVVNTLPLSTTTSILDGIDDDIEVKYTESEEIMINEFLKFVNYWDPDIFAGYEIQMLSWGYLIERACVLNINLMSRLGRSTISSKFREEQKDISTITGRIVLDVWRLMRHEVALQSYTFENIVYKILNKRVPWYSFKTLSFWWDHRTMLYRHRVVKYYTFRVVTIFQLFEKLDIMGRTSELARLFGIQFYEVLSRGSQFRVESMMLRLAKPLNFIPVSPNVQQRAAMRAPEYIPLVMEPESKLYNDPMIVLDFQSLYPSIIIAYNYCFTTCIGRVQCLGKNSPFEFGATQLKVPRKLVEKLAKKDLLNFSPCGVAFVKKDVRDGILPRMLREILDTRLMVKNSMKENRKDPLLQKVLHNRQLGLKLIANVTYGYTAANFSGRMCCVEIGDSVVSKGRETLQRAIALVDKTPEWGAKVVYGDTDSLFVLVPGQSRETAFKVGKEIAEAVTNDNPDPIKLKLEKVYQPCILQTKKRYVGYMYENSDVKEPVYDAKGIETVRRDGCPAVAKMLEKCLKILFDTKDVSLIKKYVLRQFHKILSGRVSIQDLTFAKEYRGASGYRPGACVPALELARKWTTSDKRSEPRCGSRVPYIIVNGPPGFPLIRLVRSPTDLLNDQTLRPNAIYYITRVIIPALNRCLNLIGADVNIWFNRMSRKQINYLPNSSPAKKSTISQYFSTSSCACCGELSNNGLCDVCSGKPQKTVVTLMEKMRIWEENSYKTAKICQCCTGFNGEIPCISLDCPVLYKRVIQNKDIQQCDYIRQLLQTCDF